MLKILDIIQVGEGENKNKGVITDFVERDGISKVEFSFSSNGFVGYTTPKSCIKLGSLTKTSKYISKLLRHDPEDLVMDKEGYVEVKDLLNKVKISRADLQVLVKLSDKKRFLLSEDSSKIRANQGHSIKDIDVKMRKVTDKNLILYHGTSDANFTKIKKTGHLKSMNRQYVHLSKDEETATTVGLRHAKNKKDLVILKINSGTLINKGISLYISDNGVYQSGDIPVKYLEIVK